MSIVIELDSFEVAVLATLFSRMELPVHTIQVTITSDRVQFNFDNAGWSPPMGRAVS